MGGSGGGGGGGYGGDGVEWPASDFGSAEVLSNKDSRSLEVREQ